MPPRPDDDLYALETLLPPPARAVRDRVRAFVEEELLPGASERWERGEFPLALARRLGELGVLGGPIQGHGCPGLDALSHGLVFEELFRGDASFGTFAVVQSSLAMAAIDRGGDEAQKQRWLPPLARCRRLAAFALTEPEAGSDAAAMRTVARRAGDRYVLSGSKRWIGNGAQADVLVVWARLLEPGEDGPGRVGALLVEGGTPGLVATPIQGKLAMRSVEQAELRFEECEVPAANRLPRAVGFRAAVEVLTGSRYTVAWGALGSAVACYQAARAHTLERQQFGRPLAGFQLVQEKLVAMLAALTQSRLLLLRLAQIVDAGALTPAAASLAKLTVGRAARAVAREARALLGGVGILGERQVLRHLADLEAMVTYEGSEEINTLVVGRAITGLDAVH